MWQSTLPIMYLFGPGAPQSIAASRARGNARLTGTRPLADLGVGRSWTQSKPPELPSHTDSVEIRPGARRCARAICHFQGLPLTQWKGQSGSEAGVVLAGAWGTSVHITGAALVPGSIDGEPHLPADSVADMPLKSGILRTIFGVWDDFGRPLLANPRAKRTRPVRPGF